MPIKNKLATGSTVRFTAMAQMQLIHPDFFNLQIFYFIWETAMPTRRNPVVRHGALLRKGGAHTKTVSGQRHQSRLQLEDEIEEYFLHQEKPQSKPDSGTDKKRDTGQNDTAPFFCLLFSRFEKY